MEDLVSTMQSVYYLAKLYLYCDFIQPPILIVRFMFNLRQLSEASNVRSTANSDAQHFSRFSAPNFRMTSYSLGNIGEPLDFGQAKRDLYEDNGTDAAEAISGIAEAGNRGTVTDEGRPPVAGPSSARWAIEGVFDDAKILQVVSVCSSPNCLPTFHCQRNGQVASAIA